MPTKILLLACYAIALSAQTLIVGNSLVQLNGQANGPQVTQTVPLTAAPNASTAFTASVANCVGGNWLAVSPTTGATPATLTLTATPGVLTQGNYACTVNLASASSNLSITVLFVVTSGTGSGTLGANPAAIALYHQLGQTAPTQSVTITSTTQNQFFSATAVSSPSNWLLVNGTAATTGTTGQTGTFTVSTNPSGLVGGTYSGRIDITAAGVNTLSIPVTLTVTVNPILQASPGSLTFNYQLNTATQPPPQQITLTSTGSQLTNITASATTASCGVGWLVVAPLSPQFTPATLSVSVTIPSTAPNVCNGNINIIAPGAQNPSVQIPVVLNLSNSPALNVTPNQLNFTFQTGGTAPSGTVALSSTGTPLTFTATTSVATPVGSNWLTVSAASGATPAVITIGTSPAGLAAGTYTGAVTITSPGASNVTQTVGVSLTVTDSPTLIVTPTQLSFAFQMTGNQPAAQLVNVASSSGASLQYAVTASTITGSGWLNVTTGQSGFTPNAFTVSVTTAGLAPGRYDGNINVSPTGSTAPAIQIPVTLFVSNSALMITSPSSVTYNLPAGSSTVDTTKLISVTSTDGTVINYNVLSSTTGGLGWLLVGQGTASTPSNVSLGANPSGLAVGRYSGQVTITSLTPGVTNSPQTIPVTLNITPTATLAASPPSLNFSQISGQGAPANQTISVSSSIGSLNFAASATSAFGSWLSITPNSGATNNMLTVSVNGAGLPAGTYNGSILIVSPGAVSSITVPVTLTVTVSQLLVPSFYITQLYRDFLSRDPDSAGLNYWVAQLPIQGREQIAYGLFTSPEFQSNGFFVVSAYRSVLGRDPDFGGWQFHTARLSNGVTQQQLIDEFIVSPEFVQTYGALNNTAFVNLVYQNVLGRAPDPGGAAFYTGLLNANQLTRGQMMWQFTVGVEFHQRIQNRALATLLYIGFLRRSPEPAGADYWAAQLNAGAGPATVCGYFVNSVEYLGRY